MLQPSSFGGYGGLEGVEFAARCPPDVQKDTRIVAVCGIPDFKAAPQDDGWFFSDFFLLYQMLGSRRACKFNISPFSSYSLPLILTQA